ncbi:hypothetical protein CgunFtcFv8_015064 [Champsocephalus gunnari]|uniref:Uncharacterized protein n=1 Tax=Champsocephalus gunnari TaxID=52237 RepID=A0AAN8E4W9_CHAGU|nr:hypothetical protein CgunFtcFv8_015064 [Champsocephalus gunnari]
MLQVLSSSTLQPERAKKTTHFQQNLSPNQPGSVPIGRGFLELNILGPLKNYKELHTNSLSMDEYCEQLWYREKRRQQKLRALKLKQESRKARVRRHNPPEGPL